MPRSAVKLLAVFSILLLMAAPSAAGKRKTDKQTFTATNAPYPVSGSVVPGGCANGEEGVHKTTVAYKTPGKGVMTVDLDNFAGDWDLHVAVNGNIIASSTSDNTAVAGEQLSGLPFGKGTQVEVIACNWAGGPTADGLITYKYKK